MKFYSVAESELELVSLLNTLSVLLFSIGAFLLAIAAPVVFDLISSACAGPAKTDGEIRRVGLTIVGLGIPAILCFIGGYIAILKRSAKWKKIGLKPESVTSKP